ncbi:MAG: cadherin-like beta sandwich domain-containing protein, partial [Saccharofermentanales bacterium]
MNFAKKTITMFSVISLILMMISFTAVAANISSSITGPTVVRAGDALAVSVKADGEMLRAVSGEIRYNADYLSYVSNAGLPGGWKFDEFDAATPGVILFLAIDDKMEAPLSGNTRLFSLTFQVKSDVDAGTAIRITSTNIQASDGETDFTSPGFTYSVDLAAPLSGNNLLSSLKASNAVLAPAFDKNTTWYTTSVPFSVTSLDLTATAGDPKAKVAVAGNKLAAAGTTDVVVTVTAENGSKKTYTIRVTRAQDPDYKASGIADLKSITPSAGILSPPFDAGVVQYYVYLPNEITKFAAEGAPKDVKGTVAAGAEIGLEVGVNEYVIAGVAEDGTRKEYRITVQRMPLPGESAPTPTAEPEEESV